MRFRSEWLTLVTLTIVVAGGLALPRGSMPGSAGPKRGDTTGVGIDDRPVGSIRAADRSRPGRTKPAAVRP